MPELEPDTPEVCSVCSVAEDDCACDECNNCDEKVRTVCGECEECSSCCDCWKCDDCGSKYDDGEGGKCSRCQLCKGCCGNNSDCFYCEGCEERKEASDKCEVCERCDDCCSCTRCGRSSCDCRSDCNGNNDVYICSNCYRCECCHCSCSSCNHCGERSSDSVCSNCDNCEGCCECSRCNNCDSRVSSLDCGECERCDDCGCNCGSNYTPRRPTPPPPAVIPQPRWDYDRTDTTLPDTTFVANVVIDGAYDINTRCGTCTRYACRCRNCWIIEDGKLPFVNHKYHDQFGGETCPTCHTCSAHCTASIECRSCKVDGSTRKHHSLCELCKYCPSHCGCTKCRCCAKPINHDELCYACYHSKEHCKCPKCPKCGVRGDRCNHCDHCKDCCLSDDSECSYNIVRRVHGGSYPIPKDFNDGNDIKFHAPENLLGYKTNTSRRFTSIELETNNYSDMGKLRRLWNAINKWGIVAKSDGSIGDFPNAMEFNLAPAAGDKMIEQVNDICSALQFAGCEPDHQCGIHVHVDCRDVRADDLKRIIDVYVRVERALFNLCEPRRLGGTYSQVCGGDYKAYGKTGKEVRLKLTEEFFNSKRVKTRVGTSKGAIKHERAKDYGSHYVSARNEGAAQQYATRYRALNLVSFFIRRTVEFRHFHSTVDPIEVQNWAMVCSHVIDAAVKLSHRQVEGLPNNSRKALLAILPPHMHAWVTAQWLRFDEMVNGNHSFKRNRENFMNSVWRTS